MQQLVEYINQFEKENISTAAENVGNNSYIEIAPIIQPAQQNIQTIGPSQQSVSSMTDIDAIENSTKLRLSASSLSSSADSSSNDITNDYDDIFANNIELFDTNEKNKNETTTTTFKITPNETDPMIVSTTNLNSILSSSSNPGKNSNNQISSQFIDRRTYIINKVYDICENKASKEDNECMLNEETDIENEDQYEKVVLNPRKFSAKEECIESDYGEYHNDLLVSSMNCTADSIMQATNIKIVGKMTNPEHDHIYANVTSFETKNGLI